MKLPGPDHPIAIAPEAGRVRVIVNGETIAETTSALVLREASYPAVFYFPRRDVVMARLAPTARSTHCPYKGHASYYSIRAREGVIENAAWSYEQPYPAMAPIAGRLAFYRERVDIVEG